MAAVQSSPTSLLGGASWERSQAEGIRADLRTCPTRTPGFRPLPRGRCSKSGRVGQAGHGRRRLRALRSGASLNWRSSWRSAPVGALARSRGRVRTRPRQRSAMGRWPRRRGTTPGFGASARSANQREYLTLGYRLASWAPTSRPAYRGFDRTRDRVTAASKALAGGLLLRPRRLRGPRPSLESGLCLMAQGSS
jgi:hypothetical protein